MAKRDIGETNSSIESTNPGTEVRSDTTNTNSSTTEKPKRRRRTKEEIERDAAGTKEETQVQSILIDTEFTKTNTDQPKQKRTRSSGSKELTALSDNLTMVLQAGFTVTGGLMKDSATWNLSDEEANSIAQPAARIMQNTRWQKETLNKHNKHIIYL